MNIYVPLEPVPVGSRVFQVFTLSTQSTQEPVPTLACVQSSLMVHAYRVGTLPIPALVTSTQLLSYLYLVT